MPRKAKQQKRKIPVVIDGRSIDVTLTPPTGRRKSWYAYWSGLVTSKSTGQDEFDSAVVAVTDMLKNGGRKRVAADMVLSDDEFEEIQRRHFGKRKDPEAKKRAERSLEACLEAIYAFREISKRSPIATATPADCEEFQHEALTMPSNWRRPAKGERVEEVAPLSPNTIVKWSTALQAAFERVNRNAGKKCVRGFVKEEKLLHENPWHKFTWIERRKKELRQFDHSELIALLDYFDEKWPGLRFAPALAKVLLWSWGRKEEISSLKWTSLRVVGNEYHFDSTGKWAVNKWFRIPKPLFEELKAIMTESPYVFASYAEDLRKFYEERGSHRGGQVRDDFSPENVGEWFYRRIADWSASLPNGSANVHDFRKTTLQYARSGEDVNRQVAADAHVSAEVMMTHYAKESDREMRAKSNRIYKRILNSLSVDVAVRYGYKETEFDRLTEGLDAARSRGDWGQVAELAERLAALKCPTPTESVT